MRQPCVIGLIPLLLRRLGMRRRCRPIAPARSASVPGGAVALVGPSPLGSPVAVGVETIATGSSRPFSSFTPRATTAGGSSSTRSA